MFKIHSESNSLDLFTSVIKRIFHFTTVETCTFIWNGHLLPFSAESSIIFNMVVAAERNQLKTLLVEQIISSKMEKLTVL